MYTGELNKLIFIIHKTDLLVSHSSTLD